MPDSLSLRESRQEREEREARRDDVLRVNQERVPDDETTLLWSHHREIDSMRDRLRVEWQRRPWVMLGATLLAIILLGVLLWFEIPQGIIAAVPPIGWTALWYGAIGAIVAGAVATVVVLRISDPVGREVLDLDPISSRHRHLRIGGDVWQDLRVLTPWGEEVSTEELNEISVNGRSGVELMDLRVPQDGPPTCVATWMGESDSATLRTYQHAVVHARKRLAKRADRALALEANREALVREAAERVVVDMIRTSEESSMPSGDRIQTTVEDVLDDLGMDDSLATDLRDDRVPDDVDLDVDRSDGSTSSSSGERATGLGVDS